MKWLEGFSTFVNKVLLWFAGLALLALLLLTVTDMVLRAWGVTLAGSYEVIGWLSACAMALALGAVQQHKGHVAVQLLENRFGPRLKAAVDLVTCLLALLLFVAVAWYVAKYGQVLQRTGSLSETLRVVVYPWVYVVAVGCTGLALSLLVDFVRATINLFVPHGRS
ncbi:TRAP transporter small permease [Rhodocyclaceae bacterium SMB388]